MTEGLIVDLFAGGGGASAGIEGGVIEQLALLPGPMTLHDRLVASEAVAPAPAQRRAIEEAIAAWIRGHGMWGATRHEVELAFNLKTQTACWRLRGLEKAGVIAKTERKREGCTVYLAV